METDSPSVHVCYVMQDGEPVAQFETNDIGELTITLEGGECERAGALIAGAIGPIALEMAVKLPREWRCSSRKRYIRLLMSYGCSRNDACELTSIVQDPMGPKSYQELFFSTMAVFAAYTTERKNEL